MAGVSRFSPEEKAEIVLMALRMPDKVSEICRGKGVSPITYNKWKRKYIIGGMDAMKGSADGKQLSEDLRRRNHELVSTVGHLYIEILTIKKKMGIE
jgi:transposase-like protein